MDRLGLAWLVVSLGLRASQGRRLCSVALKQQVLRFSKALRQLAAQLEYSRQNLLHSMRSAKPRPRCNVDLSVRLGWLWVLSGLYGLK